MRLCFLIIVGFPFLLSAQIPTQIYVDGSEFTQKTFSDSVSASLFVEKLIDNWSEKGYVFSGVDSVVHNQGMSNYYLHRGAQYRLQFSSDNDNREKENPQKQLNELVNNGYPFAALNQTVDSVQSKLAFLSLAIEPGPLVLYDSAVFLAEIETKPRFIYQLLDIEPGAAFSEESFNSLGQKLDRVSFLALSKEPDVSFSNERATVFLSLREEKVSQFKGVLGLQSTQDGRNQAVGSVLLDLNNLFKSGKELELLIESFGEQSQRLDLSYQHPFLAGSNLSPFFEFSLLKQDTTFLNRELRVGFSTFLNAKLQLDVDVNRSTASILSTESEVFTGSSFGDFQLTSYGLGLRSNVVDVISPKSFFQWETFLQYGVKNILQNPSFDDTLYDSVDLRTNQISIRTNVGFQKKIGKRLFLANAFDFGWIENDQLLRNELYRLGGLNSLRGFNEKEFFARRYLLNRLELRKFTEEQSYFFLFFDQLWIDQQKGNQELPFGFGSGFVLKTRAGLFNFVIASGKSDSQRLSVDQVRVHFGYTSLF